MTKPANIMTTPEANPPLDFIRQRIADDVQAGRDNGNVVTRFPPEPNGYLHIGHAKSICLNFGVAKEFSGRCHLRFDDTNPVKEEQKYIDAIRDDIHWLGFDWGEHEYHTSDYFDQLYDWTVQIIKSGNAYVDDQNAEQIRNTRGTLTEAGIESPFRDRSVEENLNLFERMKSGEYPDGSRVLRAKIDMSSPNLNLRDPVMYRILHATHPRTGDTWCIYPMYDWAHGQSDSLERITHSLCTLEFEAHRPLYDWFVKQLDIHHPQQIEFARLNLNYTIMSKRKLLVLVESGFVFGWDDPRMPTLSGMRSRGYPPEAIRRLCDRVGIAKRENVVDLGLLEHFVRDELNRHSPRVMGVLHPLKVVIENYPENQTEELDAVNNPEDETMGTRKVPFSRILYIERDDFMEDPPRKFFRLSPGREVRLRYAYFITCTDVIRDSSTGEIMEIRCKYDPATRGGDSPDGRKVKGTLHWVSAEHALTAEVRLYDRLFIQSDPTDVAEGEDYTSSLNPDSLQVLPQCLVEPSLSNAVSGDRYQLERIGYFCVDSDSRCDNLVLNRTVALRDSWAKMEQKKK